jgi:hypothetical protein
LSGKVTTMNARIWICGTIAAVCWFLGSSVPAAVPAPAGATPAQVTLRVVAANLKTQQAILSLHDAGAEPHKVFMEKQAADLAND